MSDIDAEIAKALREDEVEFVRQFEEVGLIGQFKTVFQKQTAWVAIPSLIFGTALNVVFFYAAWQFFTVTDLNTKLHWGAGAGFVALMLGFMKVWFWMRMESNRVVREIKRVELQVARLKIP